MKDLNLDYISAAHGVQSAIKYKIDNQLTEAHSPKHLRVGIDMSKSDMLGLVELLISKGIFTQAEYIEYVRLAANTELHLHEQEIRHDTGLDISFR